MKKYRIDAYIVDDHALLSEGLAEAVSHSETVRVSHRFTTLADCRAALAERCPDVLLLDISMPDGDGVAFCQWVVSEYPKVRVVAVTIHDEYYVIRQMLESGVHGYVLKSAPVEELVRAIEQVWKGQRYISPAVERIISKGNSQSVALTKPERSILRHVCEGYSNPQIAERLNLSAETVKWYRKRLLVKLGVQNTVQLVRLALRERLIIEP